MEGTPRHNVFPCSVAPERLEALHPPCMKKEALQRLA